MTSYSAQEIEFDYVGVLFQPELVLCPISRRCVGQRHDSRYRPGIRGVTDDDFTAFFKCTNGVVLTRGLSVATGDFHRLLNGFREVRQ